jgi:hypothetical protein
MDLVAHAYGRAGLWAGIGITGVIILRFTWYSRL